MDKINIVVNASQQAGNACVMGDTEQAHCYVIAEKLAAKLKQDDRLNVYLVPKLAGTNNENLKKAISMSNVFIKGNGGKGYHVAIHTDAGYDGAGTSCFYMGTGSGEKLAKALFSEMCAITPWNDMRCYQRPELYEINGTVASAALCELSFHDKKVQAEWIHANPAKIADALYRGIYKALGIPQFEIEPDYKKLYFALKAELENLKAKYEGGK